MDNLVEGVLLELAAVALQLALARLLEWLRARYGRGDVGSDIGFSGGFRSGVRGVAPSGVPLGA